MRVLILLAAIPVILAAQDAREIVKRSCELDQKNVEAARNYTFLQRQVESDLDGAGRPKNKDTRTWDVTLQEGSPYRRLVARDDRPLTAKEQQQEQEKLQKSIELRRKETPEQRDARIADWERKRKKQREPLKELPDAFDFQLVREESLDGQAVYVIDATPKRGYKPKTTNTSFFPKVKARLWIAKSDYQWAKVEMDIMDTISFGGFLLRVNKGGHLMIEQARINGEVWLPKRVTLEASARL
ncbi:MAG TPA: hypothetical protein VGH38_11605, partial [Bryobacteraceae bacterium]